MVLIQFDLPKRIDQELKYYAIKHEISDKRNAIIKILSEKLEVQIKGYQSEGSINKRLNGGMK